MTVRAAVLSGALVLCASAIAAQVLVPPGTPREHDIRPGPGVTDTRMLSNWAPTLKNTPGDSPVYILDGQEPGGTVFVAGGTHGNEIAGIMAAITLIEHATVQKGRLIVIPHANNSAITDADPERPGPAFITLTTPSGERRFLYGSRRTKAAHQGAPDPAKYHHPNPKSTEDLAGTEARNLNRAYPGVADGTLTQRMAFAVMQVLRAERVTIAFDFHEAGPDSRLAWMVVANPKNLEIAAVAVLDLEAQGLAMKLEPSSETFRGLSHREWGDGTAAQAFLFETPSPSMVSNTKGVDFVNDPKLPLSRRVGGQLASFTAVMAAYNADAPAASSVTLGGIPAMADMITTGVGAWLR
jgi:predicted deacylase